MVQLKEELRRTEVDRDKEMDRVTARLDRHEQKIHDTEKENAGIMQQLRGLDKSMTEIKEMLIRIAPGG